jgi:hypothetical protein
MTHRRVLIGVLAVVLALGATVASLAQTSGGGGADPKALFEELKKLQGDWDAQWQSRTYQADKPAVRTQIRVIAGGTAVRETTGTGTDQEMASIYHLDGNDLVITHYCALGNQPQMRLSKTKSKLAKAGAAAAAAGDNATTLSFGLSRVSNLAPPVTAKAGTAAAAKKNPASSYMRLDEIKIVNPDLVETHWTIFQNGKKFAERVSTLKRVKT